MNLMGSRGGTMNYRASPNRKLKELKQSDKKKCVLCSTKDTSEKTCGTLYQINDIVVHHFCILLSKHSVQNGDDNEGLLGFLYDDIKKVIRRGDKEFCFYCKKKGATISCIKPRCRKIFHLPCGLKNGSMHQYYGEFKSFCKQHRVIPKIPATELKNRANVECSICTNLVKPSTSSSTFWAPCCKQSWFHRDCIQDLCLNSGYLLKCPLCNNINTFKSRVLQLGIYIPARDASWERVPDAYEELDVRHSTCNSDICLCQYTDLRNHQELSGDWKIILCCTCGSSGTHVRCGKLKNDQTLWICDVCKSVVNEPIP